MTITVRYFAGIREKFGRETDELSLADLSSPTAEGVLEYLSDESEWLLGAKRHLRCAVNLEFVSWEHELKDGDEIAFIPPVSGGVDLKSEDGRFLLTKQPLDPMAVRELVRGPDKGAVILFEGSVRDHTGDRIVSFLEYDAYPEMALKSLEQCAAEARTQFEGVEVAIHHRWGRMEIGESAVVTAVSHAHRANAYEASKFVIDRLKEIVPIWKKEVSPDGEEWIGQGP